MNEPKKCCGVVEGRCCCNCKHQSIIYKHPLNRGEAKGSILEPMGYVCSGLDDKIFMDRKHGMCEEHEFKNK